VRTERSNSVVTTVSDILHSEEQVLSSWKEIAAYLGKSIRTVQRYEHDLGLPVHRPSVNRQTVVAYRTELREWIVHTSEPRPSSIFSRPH